MSKTVTTALKSHLAQSITTLATCWQIVRLDGNSFAFTTLDEDLVVSGVTYSSVAGFSRTAIATGSTGEVDNTEAIGFFAAGGVTEQDLKNGLFDYASVYVFCVNWADLTQGICRLRRGWLGEVTRSPSGAFHAEIRGLTQALVQETGVEYSPICRADLGDAQCTIPIKPGPWAPSFPFLAGAYVQAATQSSDALLQAIFKATTAGTSGGTEPAWNTTIGATTTDGTVVWTSEPYWRVIGTVAAVTSEKEFTANALTFPAMPTSVATEMAVQGVVSFRGNIAAGTSITVSDGTHSHSITAISDVSQNAAVAWFAVWIASIHDWTLTISQIGGNFYFTNTGGGAASITKANDTQGSVVIRNFTANPLFGGTVTWISGQNAGRSMEVKYFDGTTFDITLWLGMYFPITIGDRFFIYPGCDKTRNACYFIYNNILNMRAEPDMPGLDTVLSYPTA